MACAQNAPCLCGKPKSWRSADGTIERGAGVHAAETPPDVPVKRAIGCLRLSDHVVCTGGLFSDCTLSDPPSPDMRAGGESGGRRPMLAPGRPRRDQRCPGRLWPRPAPSARWCWWTLPRTMRRVAHPAPSLTGRERSSLGARAGQHDAAASPRLMSSPAQSMRASRGRARRLVPAAGARRLPRRSRIR